MSLEDEAVIRRVLAAAVDGPYFPEWEFDVLFGLSRDAVAEVLAAWPDPPAEAPPHYDSPAKAQWVAVNNALNHLLGYPHGVDQADLEHDLGAPLRRVAETLQRWRGDEEYDPTGLGYFNRLS